MTPRRESVAAMANSEQPPIIASSGGAGSGFARPSTAGLRRVKMPLKKPRVVEITEDNMYALVNEI